MTDLVRLGVPIAFALFALLFAYSTRNMDFRATALPRLAIVTILVLAVVVMAREVVGLMRERAEVRDGRPSFAAELRKTYLQPLATIALLAAYVHAIPRLGFAPVTALFLVAMCVVIGVPWRRLPLAVLTMLVVTALAQFFFYHVLQIQLP